MQGADDTASPNGEGFTVTKRLLRDDGSVLWVTKTVVKAEFEAVSGADGEPAAIMATMAPLVPPTSPETPAALLTTARRMRVARRDRSDSFGAMLFAEPAWDIMLAVYIAEAEGRAFQIADACDATGLPSPLATRWLRALCAERMLSEESTAGHFTLAASIHPRLEAYLGRRLAVVEDGDAPL